jgi:hypothetical protein
MIADKSEAAARAACRDRFIEFLFNVDARPSQPRIDVAARSLLSAKKGFVRHFCGECRHSAE